jgi:hypothetical protein
MCWENLSVLYFEHSSDDKNIMQHVIAPDTATSKVNEKKIHTKTEK